ncbi:MAG: Omp28-related outer membrane protein [Bacteroidia bacterium]|nr:Omp28-related outer membrane protein [Bacteroidia bacterium]
MRKIYLFLLVMVCSLGLQAQIYSDDFESYNVNDYMGVVNSTYWTTWSNAPGTSEDVKVTNAQASSGSNSLYFNATSSSGGPQDVILKFGNTYTSGIFTFQADFMVPSGKNGYFNIQASPVAGTAWTLNCNMSGGGISMDGLATGSYTPGSWFTLKLVANLTLGSWQFYIDGISQGTWNNPNNSIATIDLYPTAGSSFYVDDVSFNHTTYTLPNLNAGVSGVDMVGSVAGQSIYPVVTVKNVGVNTLNSFDLKLTYNGSTITENVSGLSLASLASTQVEFSSPVTLVSGTNTAWGIVSNANGMGQDGDSGDDTLAQTVNPIVPAPGKIVVGEEATGTWCQWCPRGAVFMARWNSKYQGFFAPIAVHNGDPMTVADYDAGVGNLISGYPSSLVDRLGDQDPSDMLLDIESQLQVTPAAIPVNGALWDSNTRELKVSITSTWNSSVTGDYRIACVLTEDSVTGTGSGYNQSNAYSGGGNGPMGGFENLPFTVPAAQMVYDFVARALSPQFDGMPGSFPTSISSGSSYTHNFTFTLPVDWDENQMHIVGMIIAPNGQIENASFTNIGDAVNNGFILGADQGPVTYLNGPDQKVKLYPNPTSGDAFAVVDLDGGQEVSLQITDLMGRVMWERSYGQLTGPQTLPLRTAGLTAGIYQVVVNVDGKVISEKLIIK